MKNKTPKMLKVTYNWVAHSLEQKKFEQKVVPDKKKTYNRKKEKQVSYND